jgi:hypothetical protein
LLRETSAEYHGVDIEQAEGASEAQNRAARRKERALRRGKRKTPQSAPRYQSLVKPPSTKPPKVAEGKDFPVVSAQSRARPPPSPRAAFTVPEFYAAHRISVARYYEIKKEGWGPAEMIIGRRRIISFEAAARWRAEREAASA